MVVQSVLIPKNKFTLEKAKKYIKDNNYKLKKIDITNNYYRFRQEDPEKFDEKKYFTKEINDGIKLIIGEYK